MCEYTHLAQTLEGVRHPCWCRREWIVKADAARRASEIAQARKGSIPANDRWRAGQAATGRLNRVAQAGRHAVDDRWMPRWTRSSTLPGRRQRAGGGGSVDLQVVQRSR